MHDLAFFQVYTFQNMAGSGYYLKIWDGVVCGLIACALGVKVEADGLVSFQTGYYPKVLANKFDAIRIEESMKNIVFQTITDRRLGTHLSFPEYLTNPSGG